MSETNFSSYIPNMNLQEILEARKKKKLCQVRHHIKALLRAGDTELKHAVKLNV
ncbi:hypothetical protein [Methanosarcina sp. MSH10X1]|uniref:hypothetical protein n=1 Tax=Methanosarcina sp. MSH10X1 TaxID=2507075 RepID=UPI0013E3EFAA|nr:hypothetical protein [Methanosarcina sp. MSH10X1]